MGFDFMGYLKPSNSDISYLKTCGIQKFNIKRKCFPKLKVFLSFEKSLADEYVGFQVACSIK